MDEYNFMGHNDDNTEGEDRQRPSIDGSSKTDERSLDKTAESIGIDDINNSDKQQQQQPPPIVDNDSMNKFFNRVASSYMHTRTSMGEIVLCDGSSKADESTLSKEDTVYSHGANAAVYKKKRSRSSGLRVETRGGNGVGSSSGSPPNTNNNGSGGEKKNTRMSSIKNLGSSFVRRGRSRGRTRNKKEQQQGMPEESVSTTPTSSNRKLKVAAPEGLDVLSAQFQHQQSQGSSSSAAASSNVDSSDRSNKSRRGRSRSLVRKLHINPFRKSANKTAHEEEEDDMAVIEEEEQLPPHSRRGSSLDMASSRHSSGGGGGSPNQRKRTAQSLPRKISQTPSTRNLSMSDSRHSFESSVTDLSSHRKPAKRKKCLVCRQKIPRGDGIKYMDFHFCGKDCFQCTSCRCELSAAAVKGADDDDDDDDGTTGDNNNAKNKKKKPNGDIQIISNARGSFVQCGECAMNMVGLKARVPTLNDSKNDGSDLFKQSIHMESSDDGMIEFESTPAIATTPAGLTAVTETTDYTEHLSLAAKRLLGKIAVNLCIVADSGRSKENEQLASLQFMLNEECNPKSSRNREVFMCPYEQNMSTKVLYELDSDAFGNPNYDGYACSVNNLEDNQDKPARTTFVSLPKLDSDEIDGTISEKLEVDMVWVDDEEDSCTSHDITPEPVGPAKLSIEPFQSTDINKDTVMKVLRQTWEYEAEDNITYVFSFVAPFKKIYISWVIDEGDELDLTQCQFDVTVRYEPPYYEAEQDANAGETKESAIGTSLGGSQANTLQTNKLAAASDRTMPYASTVNQVIYEDGAEDSLDHDCMPGEVYVKTMSIDSTVTTAGMGHSSSFLSRKKEHLDPDRDENDMFSELLSMASCINSIIALPSIVHVRINKQDDNNEVGLSLIEKNGATVVAEVSKSGLFAKSHIKEGCEILAINGQCVRGPRSVMRIMKDTIGNYLVMVTDSPSPPGSRFVVKKHFHKGFGSMKSDSKLEDITFQQVNGLIRIQDIAENGIFVEQPISKGDICLSVDGIPATTEEIATRALGRSHTVAAILVFSLPEFWKSVVDYLIDEKYNRWWKTKTECTLLLGSEDCTPITLLFDQETGLCSAEGNEENEIDLSDMNTILERVMNLLRQSMEAYRTIPKERVRESSRSMSVTPSGKMKNRSDVYRRALIKLDEMRENGHISVEDYEAGRHALAQVAIQTAK